ncbi:MAG: hypothetical protein HY300_06790, partial [Verrucomicrobia bacterium]|nr:hypothetical protein [Verrucomicrobiota bacterium]
MKTSYPTPFAYSRLASGICLAALLFVSPHARAATVSPNSVTFNEDSSFNVTVTCNAASVLTTTSRNTTFIPNANLTYDTTAGTTRVLTIKPAPDRNSWVDPNNNYVDILDSVSGTTVSVYVHVLQVNDPPSFTVPANLNATADGTAKSVTAFATSVFAGPTSDEYSQTVYFDIVSNDSLGLFNVAPAIAAATSGNNGTAKLTFTPKTGSGTATIVVRGRDSGLSAAPNVNTSANQTFTITLTGINTPPSISNSGSQYGGVEDTAMVVTFTASDLETALTAASFSGTSDNTALVDSSSFGAFVNTSANNWQVAITPKADANGNCNISIIVTDGGGLTGTNKFYAVFASVNDPPKFTIPTSALTYNANAGAVTVAGFLTGVNAGPVTATDELRQQNVSFAITANDHPEFFSVQPAIPTLGPVTNGTANLTFTPQSTAGGVAHLTVVATDTGVPAASSAGQNFTITINAVNTPPVISRTPDTSGFENTDMVVAFTASDNETPNASLVLSGTSDTTTLVNAASFVSFVNTSANNWQATIRPLTNASGACYISIVVTDGGGLKATNKFYATFSLVNQPPSFTKGTNVTVYKSSAAYSAAWATAISPGPANESSQTVSFQVSNDNTNLFTTNGQPSVTSGGVLNFTPFP